MNIVISGPVIKSTNDFYRPLAEAFDLDAYGKNLDALWDLLSAGFERPLTIVWMDSSRSRAVLREKFKAIVDVLDRIVDFDESALWTETFHYSLL